MKKHKKKKRSNNGERNVDKNKVKYVIDSKGQTVALPDNQSVIRLIPQEIKEKELSTFSKEFINTLNNKGLNSNNKEFLFMIQPFYIMERLLFFTKTEFSSSSQAVKLANEIEKHPEILANREQTEFLRSIIPEDCHGRTRWYFLNVGCIDFERNLYDCKRLNAEYVLPIPYSKFIKELEPLLVTQNDIDSENICPRYQLVTNGIDLYDKSKLLSLAFERDITNNQDSHFDTLIFEMLEDYNAKRHALRDITSNQSTKCLLIINENNKYIYYPVYREVKNIIKKIFKDACCNVQYKKNCISACFLNDNKKLVLYVSGTNEKPQFLLGGRIIVGIKALKEALQNENVFQETQWFVEKVKPNIKEKESGRKPYIRKKDVIDWTKKEGINGKSRKER